MSSQTDRKDGTSDVGRVGIFWGLRNGDGSRAILTAGVDLAGAEAYGEALTFSEGHYEVWEAWRRLGTTELRRRGLPSLMREYEYEEVPRGRIVYEIVAQRFILYADRKLQTHELIARIVHLFGLSDARVRVRSDAHYRTPPRA